MYNEREQTLWSEKPPKAITTSQMKGWIRKAWVQGFAVGLVVGAAILWFITY